MTGTALIRILREILALKDWTQSSLAAELGVTQPTVSRWIGGSEPEWPQRSKILALARRLNVVDHTYDPDRVIAVVGYVGAGGEIEFREGQGPFGEADMPPGKVPATTVAVTVRGDSMAGLLEDGWTVYYDDRRDPPTSDLYDRLCVVGLDDGRVLVKNLAPGRLPGAYDLLSSNAKPLRDQAVTWAARVTFIAPSK